MAEPVIPSTLSTRELADMVGLDERTIRRWCASGRIPARRYGKLWRIKPMVLAERDPDLWEEYVEAVRRREEDSLRTLRTLRTCPARIHRCPRAGVRTPPGARDSQLTTS